MLSRKHFIQTVENSEGATSFNLHPLIRELLRKKAGERPDVHHVAARFFGERSKVSDYENMTAFNNALYHYKNAGTELYQEFIKATNPDFLGKSIKDLINSNIDASIARVKERQRRKPLELATYNELGRLFMFRDDEKKCYAMLDTGLQIDPVNEILLFSKAYALKYFSKEKEAETIFEELANLDNTYAIFQLCQIEYQAKNWRSCMRLCDWMLWLDPRNLQAFQYKGMVFFQRKKYAEALAFFDNVLKQEPESVPALQYKGMVLFHQKKYAEALVLFKKVLELYPENIPALQYKGMVLLQQKQYEEALVIFDQKLKLDPDNSQALQYKGMVLFQQRKYEEASVFFDQKLAVDPGNSQALQYKGMVLFQQRKYEEALVLFDQKLAEDPGNSQALQYKGMVLFQKKKYRESHDIFNQILDLDPGNSQALQYKGMLLFQQRRYEEALILFEQKIELEPENSQGLLYKGMILFQQRRHEEALLLFDDILVEEPENLQAIQYKGMVLFKKKRYDEAVVLFDRKLELEPDNSQALLYKGMILFQKKQYAEAISLFDRILELEPDDLQAIQYKGMVAFQQRKYAEALAFFNQKLELEPENSQALIYKGKTLVKQKDYLRAEDVLLKANRIDTKNVFIKTDLGTVLRINGKYKAAITSYEAAIELNKRNIQSYNGLFEAYINLEQYKEAVSVVDRLIALKIYDFKLLKNTLYLLINWKYGIVDYQKAADYLNHITKVKNPRAADLNSLTRIQERVRHEQQKGLFESYKAAKDYQKAVEAIDQLNNYGIHDFYLMKSGVYLLIESKYKIKDFQKAMLYISLMEKIKNLKPKQTDTVKALKAKVSRFS